MHFKLPSVLLALLTSTSFITIALAARQPANSVLLRNVATLTLRKDKQTTHRRVSALPQLKCVGGSAKGLYEVDVMRCKNSGTAYNEDDIEWTCQASLPPEFKLGSTEVICEGYNNADDPYILKGSCAVEYRIILTEEGQEKYGKKSWWDKGPSSTSDDYDSTKTGTFVSSVFWLLFIGVLFWMVYSFFTQQGNNPGGALPRRPGGFGGWGGGGGDDNDPPPPYDYQPPRKPSTRAAPAAQGFQPGFWSGALGGAAAGYVMGTRGQQNNTRPQGGSWFGGGGNNGEGTSGYRQPSSSSSSAPSPSSSRYESTGFGSTRRR